MQEFEANIRPWTSEPSPAATGCRMECTQEQDRGQREQEQRRNRERFSRELAESARQLLSLEQELGGQAGNFGAWLQIAYEVNEDFEMWCVTFVKHSRSWNRTMEQQLPNVCMTPAPLFCRQRSKTQPDI